MDKVDEIMGIIVKNSEGMSQNLTDGSPAYASSVYLNLIRKELEEMFAKN